MTLKAAATLLLALAASGQAVEIRLATFNIGAHFTTSSGGVYYPDYSLGPPGTPDFDSVRDILSRIGADVVALEEIHSVDISGNRVSALAAGLGYPHVFIAPATNTFDSSLHVAFLSRYPFLTQTALGSPAGAREMNRLIPAVKVDVPGTTRDPVLVAAHLKSGSEASDQFQRTVEMRRLTDHLATRGLTAADNFVIMGDFNLSAGNRAFASLPATGLPGSFVLGPDITFPISYFTDPTAYFRNPAITRIIPRQLDGSIVTFPGSGSTIDLFLISPVMGTRPLRTEIYNSTLDTSVTSGLPKAGSPLAAGTSAAASDHLALFGDFELDPAIPYAFHAPGETISETFAGFPGSYDPYPWVTTGGVWQGTDSGASTAAGFRAYGSVSDPALGFLSGGAGGSATAAFANQSAQVLSTLRISFTAEQWRSALAGTADTLGVELIVGGVPQPLPQLTFHSATDLPSGAIGGGVSTSENLTVGGLSIAPGDLFQLKFTFTPGTGGGPLPADVFINEFDYDDNGADTGEFVEIVAGPGFTGSVGDVTLLLYNGADGTTYGSHSLATFTAGNVTTSGHRVYSKPIGALQNGAPDGFALVVNGVVTQFISYEGQFQATAGAASGMTSTNIGVAQTGSEPEGESSLGLIGTGGIMQDFAWSKFAGIPYSAGQPNQGQTFNIPRQPQGIAIDNLAVTFISDSDGDGFTDADEAIFGSNPQDAASRFTMAFTMPAPAMARLSFPTLTGRGYTIEGSTDLAIWSAIATHAGTGSTVTADLPRTAGETRIFYRIRATMP